MSFSCTQLSASLESVSMTMSGSPVMIPQFTPFSLHAMMSVYLRCNSGQFFTSAHLPESGTSLSPIAWSCNACSRRPDSGWVRLRIVVKGKVKHGVEHVRGTLAVQQVLSRKPHLTLCELASDLFARGSL